MRLAAAFAAIFVAFITCCFAQDVVNAWYPLQPGNSWMYQNEALSGYMAHPDAEHWKTEETVASRGQDASLGGILVTERVRTFDDVRSPNAVGSITPGTHNVELVIRQNCVYEIVRPWQRGDLLRGDMPPSYCFPIEKGKIWGHRPNNDPDFEWHVVGFNLDPFGIPDGRTFHLTSREGSGMSVDRWYEEGVGLLQEIEEHHGTYDEWRSQLVKTTINGKTQNYKLKPARIMGFEGECDGPNSQHFVREDGTAFASEADCRSYYKTHRRH